MILRGAIILRPGIAAGLIKLGFIIGTLVVTLSYGLQLNSNGPLKWKSDNYHKIWRRQAPLNPCPSGYISQASGSCYKLYTRTKTWNAAKTACNSEGALLVESQDWESLRKFAFGKLGGSMFY
ncbi:unnamed protein product [Meganyctiphanes norvegica]|uniref:C-type lectin domain-containing protein n=1 Tax=Meganyctiphanes norvegica TaxID=48144 RepID=A0AAV2QWM2_MEGNR